MLPTTDIFRVIVPTADDMRALGAKMARLLRAGDFVLTSGDLGAGKTTFTQGLGEGLDVEGPVISPTFVISRIHAARGQGPDLVHVDAYRLGDWAEVEDLDLDESFPTSVTLVEWGETIAESLSDDRIEISIIRSNDPEDETRTVEFAGVGQRWLNAGLETLV